MTKTEKLEQLIEKYTELHKAEQMVESGEVLNDLQSLQEPTEEREVEIKDFSKEQIDDNDINWFRNICKAAGMDFWPYDVEEFIKMYKRDKHNIIKI